MPFTKIARLMLEQSGTITKSASDPVVDTNPRWGVGTVWLNTTTGEMFVCTDATTDANVWSNSGEGTDDIIPNPYIVATGGSEVTSGDYKIHTFNTSNPFTVTHAGSQASIEYLVIAGGATKIFSNIPNGRVILGSPAMKMDENIKLYKTLRRLPKFMEKFNKK